MARTYFKISAFKGGMCQSVSECAATRNRLLRLRVTSSRCHTHKKRTCAALEAQQNNESGNLSLSLTYISERVHAKKNKQSYLRRLKQWLMYLYVVFAIQIVRLGLSMQMAIWVFCELSPPIIIAPQAGIRDGLIALQALLKNRASFLASQAIRSTFSTQITPVPSTLLCARSKNKERGICWMSVQLSASVALQPDALKTGRTIHPSQSTDP